MTRPRSGSPESTIDDAARSAERVAARRSARRRVVRLRNALARLDDEDFGSCSECGEPIPYARLESMPDARMCVACAERAGG